MSKGDKKPNYTKKPVSVYAKQWLTHGDHEKVKPYDYAISKDNPLSHTVCAKCGKTIHLKMGNTHIHTHGWVDTLEGGHIVCPNDWIITGVKGEHYPCKPDIFEATYRKHNSDTDSDIKTLEHLFLYDDEKGWAEISSGLNQDFCGGFSSFNVKHDDGTEYCVLFKIDEIYTGG